MAAFRNNRIPWARSRYSRVQRIYQPEPARTKMHGVTGKSDAVHLSPAPTSKIMLLLLVTMTGVAPISLYMLVPALPVLASSFGRDISIAQLTVSLYMVGIACSQIIMGPLSDRFGRRPVLLAGLGLMVAA